uniref:Acetylserotonin O-methyltransferase n=1 Tax=Anolis carolinensis TaxID=28377 RepID=A0A803T366_ANOCA
MGCEGSPGFIMFSACELGVFDLLLESKELLSSAVIAERLGTSHPEMQRLLEACVGLKLLRMERKDNEGKYSRRRRQLWLPVIHNTFHCLMTCQLCACLSGFHNRMLSFVYFEAFLEIQTFTEERLQRFSIAMGDAWCLYGQELLSAFDLSCFQVVCDVGGGNGTLAKEYISLYPKATVTIFDLPKVVEGAKKQSVASEECQISFQGGKTCSF